MPGGSTEEDRLIPVWEVVDRLSAGERSKVDQVDGAEENVTFALPRELQA